MNWITNFVRPKLQAFVGKKEVPDNLWETCPKCSQMLLKKELIVNQFVCKHCDYHFRITAKERLDIFFGKNYIIMDTPKLNQILLILKITKNILRDLKMLKKKIRRMIQLLLLRVQLMEKNCYSCF